MPGSRKKLTDDELLALADELARDQDDELQEEIEELEEKYFTEIDPTAKSYRSQDGIKPFQPRAGFVPRTQEQADEANKLFAELGIKPLSDEEKDELLQASREENVRIKHWRKFATTGESVVEEVVENKGLSRREYMLNALEHRKQKCANIRERIAYVKRAAYTQPDIFLTDPIPEEYLRLLMDKFADPYLKRVRKAQEAINTIITKGLMAYIPNRLKRFMNAHAGLLLKCPGFICVTKSGNVFWAEPDVPAYFEQGTELELVREYLCHKRAYLRDPENHIDNLIDSYCAAKKAYIERLGFLYKQFLRSYGQTITYLDLLKKKPLWFDELYTLITNKTL